MFGCQINFCSEGHGWPEWEGAHLHCIRLELTPTDDDLQDPDASNEETDEVLTRQFTAFGDALGDESPAVRAEAVGGLCTLLDTYWELVPAGVTAGFLQRVAGRS